MQGMTEFKKSLNLKLTNEQVSKMFDAMDIDKSGQIDYSGISKIDITFNSKLSCSLEFIAAFLDTVVVKQEKYLKEAFQRIDSVISFLDFEKFIVNVGSKRENK